ncbi:Ohr family peroxiredoxin [Streptococcus entericus]|uniref:Ohr family peroxiredoxin n=1 Tax=Streptococcus entericus TaxID=155680 RepID=UPI000361BB90|nr:Ohr family peroxiredoxin [Streptococcus entericus]
MQKIYSTKVYNTGGRVGQAFTEDKAFQVTVVQPGTKQEGATNPEQLFAAGYASCFNGALGAVLKQKGIVAEATVSATVTLYTLPTTDLPNVQLGVAIEGHIEGVTLAESQELLELAHTVCPYSKAVAGNIEVTVTAV